MKKKSVLTAGIALIAAFSLTLPSVQSFAISALSVFRVKDVKSIQITMSDIEEIANQLSAIPEETKNQWRTQHSEMDIEAAPVEDFHEKVTTKEFASSYEFTDFDVSLPNELADEEPILKAEYTKPSELVIQASKWNEMLKSLGIKTLFRTDYDNQTLNIKYSPVFTAQYNEVILFATQGVHIDDKSGIVNGLWSDFTNMSFLTENLRTQLAVIDPTERDVYLPVIMGVGREITIGNTTGYIYTLEDVLKIPFISEQLTEEKMQSAPDNASILLWVKNGIIYGLAGEKTDNELVSIARSIR